MGLKKNPISARGEFRRGGSARAIIKGKDEINRKRFLSRGRKEIELSFNCTEGDHRHVMGRGDTVKRRSVYVQRRRN